MTNLADTTGTVPRFEMRHRLGLALEFGGVAVSAMAEELGLSRNTVGNYLSGRTEPSRAVLRVWALRTGVPFEWLRTGQITDNGGPNQGTHGVRCTRESYGSEGYGRSNVVPFPTAAAPDELELVAV